MDLYLIRGLPNSGKSTIAQVLAPENNFAADDWFEIQAESFEITYAQAFARFRNHIGDAHSWCQFQCEESMSNKTAKIAIANTFTTMKEMRPYMDLAVKYDYRVHVITVERTHNGDNEHNVPNEVIKKMAQRWQHADSRFR